MIKQLEFLPLILKGVERNQHLYAADILFQLYRCQAELSIKQLISFFRNHNHCIVWETIMTLRDLDYIKYTAHSSQELFSITQTGIEKVQIITACFRAGNVVHH